jgi:hypothetical protein
VNEDLASEIASQRGGQSKQMAGMEKQMPALSRNNILER